jgi:drug/metabolite transporter (DMT)-like permease
MTDTRIGQDDLELRLATALAPMLLAVATFALILVNSFSEPNRSIVDELLCLLSAFCLLGSATVADSIMDRYGSGDTSRFAFLGGGYFLFCLAVGTITAAIPIIYAVKINPVRPIPVWRYIIFFATGMSAVIKLMQGKEKAWTAIMFICYVAAACVSAVEL